MPPREGVKAVTAGGNPMDTKRGIDKSVETALASVLKEFGELW